MCSVAQTYEIPIARREASMSRSGPSQLEATRLMMRVLCALIVLAVGTASVDMIAAGRGQGASTATVSGTATENTGNVLANASVQLRSMSTGQLVGSTTTNANGQFSFVGLAPDTYFVEIIGAGGRIVGTSGAVVVSAGAAVTGVIATMATAPTAAAPSFFSRHAVVILGAAGAAGVAGGIAAATGGTASPSR
jgi:Carboxypeptidase regulatory-like domain